MKAVTNILSNDIVRQGLFVFAPEIIIGVDAIHAGLSALFKDAGDPVFKSFLEQIDKRLARLLYDISTTQSVYYRKECEIRAHELLSILQGWEFESL